MANLLKFYKRNNILYLSGASGESELKTILRNMKFDRIHKIWYTDATFTVFRDLWTKYKSCFMMTDPETKKWVSTASSTILRMDALQKGLLNTDKRPVVLPDGIDYVLQPYQHQKEAIAFALNVNKSALWLDMGLGKTFCAITIAKIRNKIDYLGNVKSILVICPRSLMYQWESEIARFAPNALVYTVEGTPQRKEAVIRSINKEEFSFTIITYEGLWNSMPKLMEIGFDMFVLDEATKIKNPKAKRTQATVDMCNSIPYGLALTGMAYVNNPLDLYAQFLAIDATVYGSNQWVFSNRYIDYMCMPFGKIIKGFKHMDELKSRAYLSAFSRTKDQCLDLPPRVYQVRKLPIYEAQYEWYCELLNQLKEACLVQDDDGAPLESEKSKVTIECAVAMLEKFQQITSGYITTDDGEFIWLDSPKYEEMLNILKSSSDSFIIWARHSFVLQKIQQYLAAHEIDAAILDRKCSDAKRKTIKEQFKSGELKVVILQIQSECRGNDFTCKVSPVSSIFFENTASIEERAQAEDRQHRIGMTGTAVYVDLICEDTYDEGIKMLLENKRSISEYIRRKELNILLGKCGSIGIKKISSKKKPKTPAEVKTEKQNNEIPTTVKTDLFELGFEI